MHTVYTDIQYVTFDETVNYLIVYRLSCMTFGCSVEVP
jgi:hypothetical protein